MEYKTQRENKNKPEDIVMNLILNIIYSLSDDGMLSKKISKYQRLQSLVIRRKEKERQASSGSFFLFSLTVDDDH